MDAFVTGSTGLLGSNLVRLLLAQGHKVTALVRSRTKAERVFAGLNVSFVEGDMQDVAGFAPKLAGTDVLFHTAAYFREYYTVGDHWKLLEAINVRGTVELLEAAERHGVKKAIYVSSAGVIGTKPNGAPGDETNILAPQKVENLYFRSKVLAEHAVDDFLKRSTLPVVLILPGWMFGPGDAAPTSAGQIVLDFLNQKLPGIVPGGGAPVDVRDVAQAMIVAVDRGVSGERYIVGGDNYVTMAQFFRTLEQVSGVPGPRLPIPPAIALVYGWASEQYSKLTGRPALATMEGVKTLLHWRHFTSAKAQRELGVTYRSLSETLRDTVAWYRANQPERVGGTSVARATS
jgi:dihydroflavonol-4-reductase